VKVLHFIPAYRRAVDVDVAMGIGREATWCAEQGHEYASFFVDATGIARARNLAMKVAREQGASLLLMQDADVFTLAPTFSAIEHLWRSMRRYGAAVVGAAVAVRNGRGMNCEPAHPGEVYDGIVGTGLMLIDLGRLEEIGFASPAFVHADTEDGCGVACGEDVYFCRRVTGAGGRVVVDFTIATGHASVAVDATRT
jgi:hypothetical protein